MLFNVDPATVMSKWVGEAEQLVKRLFQLAEEMGH
jgi:SpoVK/Ycf46/Vps4 family AAA+-type ATPase